MNTRLRRLLREWVDLLLLEAVGDDNELALWHRYIEGQQLYLVYTPQTFIDAVAYVWLDAIKAELKASGGDTDQVHPLLTLDETAFAPNVVMSGVKGMLVTMTQNYKGGFMVTEIVDAAAEKGNGKYLYGLACCIEGIIMPSRSSISEDAQNFWKKQYDAGYGKPLPDSVTHFNIPEIPWVDCYYKLPAGPWTSGSLKRADQRFMKRLQNMIQRSLEGLHFPPDRIVDEDDFEASFYGALGNYFQEKYKAAKNIITPRTKGAVYK